VHQAPASAAPSAATGAHHARSDAPWWRTAVIYEVYPRSFADSDGDGEGDLPGITAHLDHLVDLGVDAVWVAPWFPSPMADGGYDVTDYHDVHPRFGSLADAEALVRAAHARGIRVVMDLVANHTSHEHPWFEDAVRDGRGSPARDRYLFRDGHGPAGELPPNNWISAFGGPAWSRVTEPDGTPGQWYLHTFAPEQPDLNWHDEGVRRDFDDILRFWFDRGVDGIRVDAAPAFVKEPTLPDADYGGDVRFLAARWVDNPHWDVDGVHDVLRRWRAIGDRYDPPRMFVAEAVVNGADRLSRYLRPDEMHTAFNFEFLKAAWDGDLRGVIDATLAALAPSGAPATWVLSSHDEPRLVTRYGRARTASVHIADDEGARWDHALGLRRARAAALLLLALPGGAYVYQGEELGLPEVEDIPVDLLQDPMWVRSGHTVRGRDGCRVPIPWGGGAPPFGFSPPGVTTWLPQPPDWSALTVAAQAQDPSSMLSLYRSALRLRRQLDGLRTGALRWRASAPDVLDFDRGGDLRCVVNLSARAVELALDPRTRVLLASGRLDGTSLPADTAAWVGDER
jgi:alpha-glucosidase